MKKILILATALTFAAGSAFAAPAAAPEPKPTRQVCKTVNGKEQCKTYKVHKKKPAAKKPAAKKKTK